MKNAVVDDSDIVDILKSKKSIFEGRYLLCVPSDEDLSDLSWNGQDHLTRKVIIQKSDMLYASNPNTIKWGLGKFSESQEAYVAEFKSMKPCVFGSDSHDFETMFKSSCNRYCWIKADATFEGLKQLVYEPEERVKIQKDNPTYDYDKPFFSKIMFNEEISIFKEEDSPVIFEKNNGIYLNTGLIAIIGGRGSGKSILVNYIGNCFDKLDAGEKEILTHDKGFILQYCKNNSINSECELYSADNENALDFIFISQGELKKRTDSKKLGIEIKKLLNLQDLSFDLDIQKEIDDSLSKVVESENWFEREDEQGNSIYDRRYNEELRISNGKLLESITTKENREKLFIYTSNIEKLRNFQSDEKKLTEIKDVLSSREKELNQLISSLGNNYLITNISFSKQVEEISLHINTIQEDIKNISFQNTDIKESFKTIFNGDLLTLLQNADAYKTKIAVAEQRLKEIEIKEKELTARINEKSMAGEKIKLEYKRQAEAIDTSWQLIIDRFENPLHKEIINQIFKDRNIEIKGEIIFNKKIFNEQLKGILNLNCYKKTKDKTQEERIAEDFNISNIDSYVNFVKYDLEKFRSGDDSYKVSGNIDKLFFDLKERSNYLYVEPTITYNSKSLNKLSVGQRGTVYLCMKLATNAFSQPLIFDQPEDDLDNEFITMELIDIIRKIKRFRQIIVVTHNANLVVNCDAEQIIVANNNNEKISYLSGSLENSQINGHVCTILEGGRRAFENRRNKYSINTKIIQN